MVDAHDLVNSLKRGATHQSSISFVVRWLNPTSRGTVRDTTNHFDLSFVRTSARLAWTASEKGFHYHSDADDSVTDFAEIGNEQNGIFFV